MDRLYWHEREQIRDRAARRGSLLVELDIATLRHRVPEETDKALVFHVPEDDEYTIPWQIHAENLSEPAEGELILEVTTEVDEGPPITSLEELASKKRPRKTRRKTTKPPG